MTTGPEQLDLRALTEDAIGIEMSALDRAILSRRIGWNGAPLTQAAVARELGLTQVEVSRRERLMKDRLRRALEQRGEARKTWYLLPSQGVARAG